MKLRMANGWIILAGFWITLVSCTTVRTVAEWRDPAHAGGFESFLIVGVAKDAGIRRIFEDTFAAALDARRLSATSSYRLVSADAEPSLTALTAAAPSAQAIIMTHLVGTDEKQVYHPPSWEPAPLGLGYRRYDRYYRHVYSYVYRPGYYTQHRYVTLESNLYDAATGDLVWSMRTESVDPQSADKLIEKLVALAVGKLADERLLAGR